MIRYAMPSGVVNSCSFLRHSDHNGMVLQIIPSASMPVSQWAGGETRQLAIFPVNASVAAKDFQWRFSSATVLQDGAFSKFPKHQRLLALRHGAGFTLKVDAQQQGLSSRQQVLRFAGSANSHARLSAGPVVDINLMFDEQLQANLWSQPCRSDFQPWPGTLPAGATLLIYADEAGIDICLQHGAPVLHLAQGDVLQLSSPLQPACLFRSAANCSAVFAWLAPA